MHRINKIIMAGGLFLGMIASAEVLVASSAKGGVVEPAVNRDDERKETVKAEDVTKWGAAKLVFTGTLVNVNAGPVGRSFPPVYTHQLEFVIHDVLRGIDLQNGIRKKESLTCSNVARQKLEPTFPAGEKCLVAAGFSQGKWKIVRIEKLTTENLTSAKLALQVPFGWSIKNGQLVSPWAKLGEAAWPKAQDMNVTLRCSQTGRPALMADAAALTADPVPPDTKIKWTNPDGDGLYTVTVSNPTDQPIEIPALLRSEKGETLWADSIVILCQGRTYLAPGCQGVRGKVQPTVLKPGEKISTVINALSLKGPQWPRGGQRVEFQFCLGEKSNTQSFYYMSRHHDKIRKNSKPANEKDQNRKDSIDNLNDESSGISIKSKRNSAVTVSKHAGQVRLEVASPAGIDTLVVSRTKNTWPDSIMVRLHTKGLESLRISNSARSVTGAFSSTANRTPIIEHTALGKVSEPIDANSKHWPSLSLVSPANKIPVDDGYFEFKIPRSMMTAADGDALTVAWIDFYRN